MSSDDIDWETGPSDAPGFGECRSCKYVNASSPWVCYACARKTLRPLAPDGKRCRTCQHGFREDEDRCGNPYCNREDREWVGVWAASLRVPGSVIDDAVKRFKRLPIANGWRVVFARILAGSLIHEVPRFANEWDLLIASPTFVGSSPRDHTQLVVDEVAQYLTGHHVKVVTSESVAMEKTGETPKMSGPGMGWWERRENAEMHLRPMLRVSDPDRVVGKSVLVYDDVFTGGHTLREVALKLKAAGATKVAGVVLTRSQYGG